MNNWVKNQNEVSEKIDLTKEAKVKDDIALEIEKFCHWLEANYEFRQELVIELVNNYYLIHEGRRVGYMFFFGDEDVPLLALPVRGYPEKWPLDSILFSLLQGIDDYMAVQNGTIDQEYYDEAALEAIMDAYLKYRG